MGGLVTGFIEIKANSDAHRVGGELDNIYATPLVKWSFWARHASGIIPKITVVPLYEMSHHLSHVVFLTFVKCEKPAFSFNPQVKVHLDLVFSCNSSSISRNVGLSVG